MVDSEQQIRERAYLLWEQEGRLEGRDHEYWERARFLVGQGERAAAAPRSEPLAADGAKPKRAARSGTVANQGKVPKAAADHNKKSAGPAHKQAAGRTARPKPATQTAPPTP